MVRNENGDGGRGQRIRYARICGGVPASAGDAACGPEHARAGGSAIDARTTRHASYQISQRKRKRIEECVGWLKTVAGLRKVRHRGVRKVDWIFTFACAACNLVRMRNMAAAVPAV